MQAGAVLQASAFSRAHLVIGRIICGVGTGIDTSTVPMYQSELCPAKKRGRLVASEIFFVFFGIVLSYWYNYGMSFVSNSSSWRLPVASQVVFAIVFTPSTLGNYALMDFRLTQPCRAVLSLSSVFQSRRGTSAKLESLKRRSKFYRWYMISRLTTKIL